MNSQITIDLLSTFAQAVRYYLRYNTEYRQARNPERKSALRTARATAYRIAQEANTALHTHLLAFKEPDFVRLQARELIARWDARNECFENLANGKNTGQWHERPTDKIARLDKAESRLRDQLKAVMEILSKLTDNQ